MGIFFLNRREHESESLSSLLTPLFLSLTSPCSLIVERRLKRSLGTWDTLKKCFFVFLVEAVKTLRRNPEFTVHNSCLPAAGSHLASSFDYSKLPSLVVKEIVFLTRLI